MTIVKIDSSRQHAFQIKGRSITNANEALKLMQAESVNEGFENHLDIQVLEEIDFTQIKMTVQIY